MRYLNSLLLLRLLNILLAFWLISQLGNLLDQLAHWRQFFGSRSSQNPSQNDQQNPLTSHPLRTPLPTGTQRLEAIRLNELFARPQHKCAVRRVVGGRKDSFFVCFDNEVGATQGKFEKALSISGQKEAKFGQQFELELNVSSWSLVLPQRTQMVDALQNDVFLQFMPELEESGRFPRDRIGNMLTDQYYDLTKLDIDTELLSAGQRRIQARIQLLEWILERLNTKQLLLIFKPGLDEAMVSSTKVDDGKILLEWYRFMYSLFFRWHFALLGVRSNGRCGQAMQQFDGRHCEWRASFAHFTDFWEAKDVPAYGIGTPLEEKLRFLRHIFSQDTKNETAANCELLHLEPLAICRIKENRQFDHFVYFRYRNFDAVDAVKFRRLLGSTERMSLFCPMMFLEDENSWILDNERIKHVDSGISHSINATMVMPWPRANGASISIAWPLKPFDSLMDSIQLQSYQRNALLLDLDGAEWDVLGAVIEKEICEKWLRSFEQISLRIRIWAMEESENWRRYYLWLLRLEEECHFAKTFAYQLDASTVLLLFKRQQIVTTSLTKGK